MAPVRNRNRSLSVLLALVALLICALASTGVADAAGRVSRKPSPHLIRKVVRHNVASLPLNTLKIGVRSDLGSAITPQEQGNIGYRYAYLAGGVNTGQGWAQYADGVTQYISASEAAGVVPVFTYNQLQQSAPGNSNSDECDAELENLKNTTTMLAYFNDMKLFFQKAAGASGPVIMHFEPDLWGCVAWASVDQKPASYPFAGNANNVSAAVASSGMPELRGLPNTAAGLAQAVLRLRNDYAPKVLVAYHQSIWGTGIDLQLNHPTAAEIPQMAADTVAFYRSLHANFDLMFSEMWDRDAGYAQVVNGLGTSRWWTPTDFQNLGTYIGDVHKATGLPTIIWQIATGTTGMNNTPGNYADNKVQTLLSNTPTSRSLLKSYAGDGVIGLLFGTSAPNDTPITSSLLSYVASYNKLGAIPVSL